MLFSSKDLYNNSNIKKSTDVIDIEESSLFSFGIQCLEESNNLIRDYMYSLYRDQYVSEGVIDTLKKFDFIKMIKYIAKLFKDIIEKLFKEFIAFMTGLNYSDNTIKKYKKDIQNFNNSIEIKFPHYNYSNLEASIPDPNLFLTFSEEYQSLVGDIEDFAKNSNNKTEFASRLRGYYDKLQYDLKDNYYNKIRKNIIDSTGMIFDKEEVTAEVYPNKLFAAFRHGSTNEITCKSTITNDMIQTSLNRFLNGKDLINKTEKQKRKIQDAADRVCNMLEKKKPDNIISNRDLLDQETNNLVNSIMKSKSGQLAENCNIYVLAFSAKLDAIKEAIVTDKRILFKVVEQIIVNGNKEDN